MAEQENYVEVFERLNSEIQAASKIVHCSRIDEFSNEWTTTYHEHDHLEIMYFIKGEALVRGKEGQSSLTANDIIFYPPGFGHREYIDFSKHQEVIYIGIKVRNSFSLPKVITLSDVHKRLEWIFIELHRQNSHNELAVVKQLKNLMFSYFIQTAREGGIAIQPLKHRVEDYILSHFREHISQKELCELVHASPSYLNRRFKSDTGQTPVEFINRCRIEEAIGLLKKSHLTIETISSIVGIIDPKYFSKVFKKIMGCSPKEYRLSNK